MNAIESAIRELVAKDDANKGEQQEQREKADLKAQQRMARWAIGMFWATVAAVLVTAAGVYLIWQTLGHTRRAADAAFEIIKVTGDLGIRQMRAYVNAYDIRVSNFVPDMIAVFCVTIKNTGTTPAYKVKTLVSVGWLASPNGAVSFPSKIPSSTVVLAGSGGNVELPIETLIPYAIHQELVAGTKVAVLAGYVRYYDAFKIRRGTTFRAFLRPSDIKKGGIGVLSAAKDNNYAN